MRIFTFWEPKGNIPAYLKLCMKTWEKFIPDSEIVILDYSNIRSFIDIDLYGPELFGGNYSLPQIADAVRCMLLEQYGGLWMDLDTIILSKEFIKYFNDSKDVIFFGDSLNRTVHIGIINAIAHSSLMKLWVDGVKDKICNFTEKGKDFWAYLGNSIIYSYVKENIDEIKIIDVVKEEIFPEKVNAIPKASHQNLYVDFYFCKKYHLSDMKSYALMLHNSWTPNIFKKMCEKDFLRYDCTLANILAEIHKIPCTKDRIWQVDCSRKEKNDFRVIRKDGTIWYDPVIPGLTVNFTGENGVVELYEPLGNFEGSFISCGTGSKIIIAGTSKSHTRHGLNINARAKNNRCIIGKDFGCWGVSIGLLDEENLSVIIGDDCIMAGGIHIRPSDAHTIFDKRTKLPLNIGEDIRIGSHVWIGQNVYIKKGVIIPNNCVIGSFSCVSSKFTEENTVIAGVPAQVVRRDIDWDRRSPDKYLNDLKASL